VHSASKHPKAIKTKSDSSRGQTASEGEASDEDEILDPENPDDDGGGGYVEGPLIDFSSPYLSEKATFPRS
jgi:hypothetical protein